MLKKGDLLQPEVWMAFGWNMRTPPAPHTNDFRRPYTHVHSAALHTAVWKEKLFARKKRKFKREAEKKCKILIGVETPKLHTQRSDGKICRRTFFSSFLCRRQGIMNNTKKNKHKIVNFSENIPLIHTHFFPLSVYVCVSPDNSVYIVWL